MSQDNIIPIGNYNNFEDVLCVNKIITQAREHVSAKQVEYINKKQDNYKLKKINDVKISVKNIVKEWFH